jgi:hypothetical protein
MYSKIDVHKKIPNKETVFKATTHDGENYLYKGTQLIKQYEVLINNTKCILGIWLGLLGFVAMNLNVVLEDATLKELYYSIINKTADFGVMVSVPLDFLFIVLTPLMFFSIRSGLKDYRKKINYIILESDGMIEKIKAKPKDMTHYKTEEKTS